MVCIALYRCVRSNFYSLHEKDDISWSRLYHEVKRSAKNNHRYSCYGCLKIGHTPDDYLASHLSVFFPSRGDKGRKIVIEWGFRKFSKGTRYGFASTIPSCRIPGSVPDFFNKFLEHFHETWRELCSKTITDIEDIVCFLM